jgi:AMP nucleosidase
MKEYEFLQEQMPDELEQQIARDTLERYSGSAVDDFGSYLLLTNFPKYVHQFAEKRNIPVVEGSMFKVAHSPSEDISILDFKIGSPAAALVTDLCAHLPIKASLLLGMCGGLRKHYKVGDYFVPIAGIRGEGTSDFYFPAEVPAMANFMVQKSVTNVLEAHSIHYHIGITHTTNKRFWEFNKDFRERLQATRPQAIEMECATLFMASYRYKLPLGALLLISDLPLVREGIKTKESSASVFVRHTSEHVELGVEILKDLDESIKHQAKGVFRGVRRRFEKHEDRH